PQTQTSHIKHTHIHTHTHIYIKHPHAHTILINHTLTILINHTLTTLINHTLTSHSLTSPLITQTLTENVFHFISFSFDNKNNNSTYTSYHDIMKGLQKQFPLFCSSLITYVLVCMYHTD